MHTKFTRSTALVSLVLLQDRQNEFLLEFADGLGVENITLIHLHNQGFELISHGISLSARRIACVKSCLFTETSLNLFSPEPVRSCTTGWEQIAACDAANPVPDKTVTAGPLAQPK